jgi:hypothetical protein
MRANQGAPYLPGSVDVKAERIESLVGLFTGFRFGSSLMPP